MSDLDIVVKALRDEASWLEGGADRIEAEIGYRLRSVAERIAEAAMPPHSLNDGPEACVADCAYRIALNSQRRN